MIYYDHLPLDKDIMTALGELSINYVFQPIFLPDGKTVYAWEALMRPTDVTVTDLIAEYAKRDKLHVLEVATFFGAMQAFFLRGYEEKVAINSFPCDCMKPEEADVFLDYFGVDVRGRMIIENLVSLFHSKNYLIVAEGIEEKEEFEYLVGLGIDLFQGRILSKKLAYDNKIATEKLGFRIIDEIKFCQNCKNNDIFLQKK